MTEKTHEFTCTGPIQAEVYLGSGDVVASTVDDLVATVRISPGDGRDSSRTAAENTTVEFDHDQLRIRAPESSGWGFRRGSGQIRVELRLPVDSALRTKAGSADLRLSGRLGDIDAKTGSGDITVTETSGALRVHSGSGDIRAENVGGDLSIETASGDVSASRVAGVVTVNAASADVTIDDAFGAVTVSTASGDVRLGTMRGPELHVNSASGDVTVGVPAGTRVWLDLSTLSGSTRSDLDMSQQSPTDGPAATVQVRTMSGDIHVRRVAA
jgi:DUF4097 and DUF4098 domain-containing protein YvlB